MRKNIYLFLFISFIFLSCSDDFINDYEPELVVEGWIEDGHFPIVMLTTSIRVNTEYQEISELEKYIVKWAKVTISDGVNEVILTGKVDENYFPPYIYTTGQMRGEVGKEYKITVSYQNFFVTASTTIPEVIPIDSLKAIKYGDTDSCYKIMAYFTDNKSEKNYYKLFTKNYFNEEQFLSSSMSTFDDNEIDKEGKATIEKGISIFSIEDDIKYFSFNDTVMVKLSSMDYNSYEFWNGFENISSLSRNPMFKWDKNIKSNISGGFGYWCGYGSSVSTIVIK